MSPSQVENGIVRAFNVTLFEANAAEQGSSIRVSSNGLLEYTLPAPSGRYVSIRYDLTYRLDPDEDENLDFPYACPDGTVGSSDPKYQRGQGCESLCPAGRLCGRATTVPAPCPRGHYVRATIQTAAE